MECERDYPLAGDDLATARRAIAVALVVDAAREDLHRVRAMLPDQSDMLRVLDVVGWPGARETEAVLTCADLQVLEQVVYATLLLAVEEGEKSAYRALVSERGPELADPAALIALEALAGLALRLRAPERYRRPDPRAGLPHGDSLVSPALSALAASIALPVWITDANFVYEWINPAFAGVLGVGAGEVVGSVWWRWCDPADITRVTQVMGAAALEQRTWSVEAGAGPPGGPYARLLMLAAPRFAPAGGVVGWSGICFDLTSDPALSLRLESITTAMTADSAREHLLLRQFPGMIWTTDADLRCTSSAGVALGRIGRTPNETVGRTIAELVGTDDPAHPSIAAHHRALGGESAGYLDRYHDRDFEAQIEPLRDPRGNVVGCIGIALDVTERLDARAQASRLARQLSLAQRIGRIGSGELDLVTGASLWSDEAYRLLGLDPADVDITLDVLLAHVHPEDRERVTRLHEDHVRSGIGYEVDYRIVRSGDGRVRSMRGAVEFEHDGSGRLIRIVGILQDVTPPEVVTGQSAELPALTRVQMLATTLDRASWVGPPRG